MQIIQESIKDEGHPINEILQSRNLKLRNEVFLAYINERDNTGRLIKRRVSDVKIIKESADR